MPHDMPHVGCRCLLSLAAAAYVAAMPQNLVNADPATIAPVQQLNAALLASMKAGASTPFAQRSATLAPVLEQIFDLDAVLATSVGLGWGALPNDQKAQLSAVFRRYTPASYAANFNKYTGQAFQVASAVATIGNGDVIVHSKIIAIDGSATPLDYVMRKGPSGWKIADVLANGSISRVAVQRSDFHQLLRTGGVPALVAAPEQKVANLANGTAT